MKRIFLILFFMGFGQAFAENIYGEWRGERYDYTFSGENFYGSWGSERTDFYVRGTSENIYGTVAGLRFDLYTRISSENIYGAFPCGRGDFYFRKSSRNVYGEICGSRFDFYVSHEDDVVNTAVELFINEILQHLPHPAKSSARRFILRNLGL